MLFLREWRGWLNSWYNMKWFMHTNIWSIDLSSFFYFQKPNLAVTFIIFIKFVHYTVQRKTNLIMKWTEPALVFTWLTHIQKYYHLNDKKSFALALHIASGMTKRKLLEVVLKTASVSPVKAVLGIFLLKS